MKEALLMVIAFVIASIFIFFTIILGNFWFTKTGVENAMQKNHNNSSIVKIERNIFSYSIIDYKQGGKNKKICLNSSINFSYEFVECD